MALGKICMLVTFGNVHKTRTEYIVFDIVETYIKTILKLISIFIFVSIFIFITYLSIHIILMIHIIYVLTPQD